MVRINAAVIKILQFIIVGVGLGIDIAIGIIGVSGIEIAAAVNITFSQDIPVGVIEIVGLFELGSIMDRVGNYGGFGEQPVVRYGGRNGKG